MITRRLAGPMIAGSLAIGLALGATGTILAKDATVASATTLCVEHMVAGGMMSGQGGMMSGQGGINPGTSVMPGWMGQHHATGSPVPTR